MEKTIKMPGINSTELSIMHMGVWIKYICAIEWVCDFTLSGTAACRIFFLHIFFYFMLCAVSIRVVDVNERKNLIYISLHILKWLKTIKWGEKNQHM